MPENKKRVAFYTLGCKLNFSETSTIARQFVEMGFERVSPDSEADIYIINTCSVTDQADRKCRQAIRKFIARSPQAFIAVVGCYAQLKPGEIAGIEGVDLVVGTSDKFHIPELLDAGLKKRVARVYSCDVDAISDFFPAYSSADRTRSFLKVQDGCDYHCSYCTIPLARGKSRNMPIASIVQQAREIASMGVKEVILTGVNTGDFGKSTGEAFVDLLKELDSVEGIERYRISSIEPNLITGEIVQLVATSAKFLPHFHIPLQSGSNRILGLMRRRYQREVFADKLSLIRAYMPNVFIGVDVIVGFPGETEADFDDSYNFLLGQRPSFLHIFPYSERPNTPAANLGGNVAPNVVKSRAKRLGELSSNLHKRFYQENIGKTEKVLVESTRRGDLMFGFTGNYIRVEMPYNRQWIGRIADVRLESVSPGGNVTGQILQ